MPWNMMDSLHHILAAAVLFAASWAIRAWQAYHADPVDVTKAGYIAFDELEPQVSCPLPPCLPCVHLCSSASCLLTAKSILWSEATARQMANRACNFLILLPGRCLVRSIKRRSA